MRKYPNVGICFCGSKIYHGARDEWEIWNKDKDSFKPGIIASREYMLGSMFGLKPARRFGYEWFQMTATFLVRRDKLNEAMRLYDLFKWKIRVGDGVFSMGVGSVSDAYYLEDIVSVYRRLPTGLSTRDGDAGLVDTLVIRLYYLVKVFGLGTYDAPDRVRRIFVRAASSHKAYQCGRLMVLPYIWHLLRHRSSYKFIRRSLLCALSNCVPLSFVRRVICGLVFRYERYVRPLGMPLDMQKAYVEFVTGNWSEVIHDRD